MSHLTEGSINQFIDGLLSSMPEQLKLCCSQYKPDYKEWVRNFVLLNLVASESGSRLGVTMLAHPDPTMVHNHGKRRNRAITKIRKYYEQDRISFLSSEIGSKYSPFNKLKEAIENGFLKTENAVMLADQHFDEWDQKIRIPNGYRDHTDEIIWTGITDYKYISEYDTDRSLGQYIEIDLTDFIYLYAKRNISKYMYTANISTETSMFAAGKKSSRAREAYASEEIDMERPLIAGYRIQSAKEQDDSKRFELKVAGVAESSVLSYMFTNAMRSYARGSGSFTVVGTLADICAAMYGEKKKYASSEYNQAKATIESLRNLVLWSNDKMTTVPLFDVITTEWTAENTEEDKKSNTSGFVAKIGSVLISDIVSRKFSLINSHEMASLKSSGGLAKLLYPRFRRDRVGAIYLRNEKQTTYSYLELTMIAKTTGRSKKERETNYIAALQEMKDKNVLIQDFIYKKNQTSKEPMVWITWLPLSDAEVQDIVTIEPSNEPMEPALIETASEA